MAIPAKVASYLKKNKTQSETVSHKKVFTAYDLAQTLKLKLNEIAKTLLVKVDKRFVLVVVPAHYKLDFGKLKKLLKAKSVSIAKEAEMVKQLKVKPGAITPFGGIHKVAVVLDRGLAKAGKALFGTGSFTESLRLKVTDFIKLEQPTTGSVGAPAGLKLQVKAKKKK